MKNWIKKSLKKYLKEAISTKPVYGSGFSHTIFKSNKYPNRLFKIGTKYTVEYWVDIFEKYPKFFPKVYRVFPSKKDPNYLIVEIEKLNTTDAERDFKFMTDFLRNAKIYMTYDDETEDEDRGEIIKFTYFPIYPKDLLLDKLRDFIYGNKISHEVYLLFEKWIEFINELVDATRNDLRGFLDFHAGNYAYDNNGNLKCIDI